MAGEADDPDPVNGALDLAQEPRQHGIRLRLAAEEGNLDAVGEVLVDEHCNVLAVSQCFGEPDRSVATGRN